MNKSNSKWSSDQNIKGKNEIKHLELRAPKGRKTFSLLGGGHQGWLGVEGTACKPVTLSARRAWGLSVRCRPIHVCSKLSPWPAGFQDQCSREQLSKRPSHSPSLSLKTKTHSTNRKYFKSSLLSGALVSLKKSWLVALGESWSLPSTDAQSQQKQLSTAPVKLCEQPRAETSGAHTALFSTVFWSREVFHEC